MPSITVVNMEGSSVGTIDLAESVFGIEPNAAVMHQMVVRQELPSGHTAASCSLPSPEATASQSTRR